MSLAIFLTTVGVEFFFIWWFDPIDFSWSRKRRILSFFILLAAWSLVGRQPAMAMPYSARAAQS